MTTTPNPVLDDFREAVADKPYLWHELFGRLQVLAPVALEEAIRNTLEGRR